MKKPSKEARLVIGGESRVELLPPEVAAFTKAKATRRALIGVVVAAALVCGGGYASATTLSLASAARLAAEQDRTSSLIQERSKFIAVSAVENQLATAIAAEQLGSSTEIDWNGYMSAVGATLPPGVVLTAFNAETATPLQPHAQATVPLQGARIATLVLSAVSVGLPEVEQWLESLAGLDGFVDATPGSVAVGEQGLYSVTVTMHVNSDAYSKRFAPPVDESTAQEEEVE